ncbi:hypothetical protein DEO72_LG8g2346 [Vigna unguiculata]|uniref:Uncharacterized protein n=1 Tax=Vigna unguiculata TaxID=3917 RepID=A0A4D6MS26_VIGUN|nr:hypothetical protein DEO72_LG8g2346 [Vigna unguiculata]
MSRSEGCSCSSWGSQKQSVSSTGGSYRVLGECPLCFCAENAVLRVAKTVRNAGKQFWGGVVGMRYLKGAITSNG